MKRGKNKIKAMILKVLKKIRNYFAKVVKKVKKLPKHIKFLIILWIFIVLLIIFLLVLCSSNKKFTAKYKVIEKDINAAALEYVKEKEIYPTVNQKLKLSVNVLVESGNLYQKTVKNKNCDGYALVYYNNKTEKYNISSYIKCDKYVTANYSSK